MYKVQNTVPLWDIQYLIIIVMAMEKWFFFEYHAGEHAAKAP